LRAGWRVALFIVVPSVAGLLGVALCAESVEGGSGVGISFDIEPAQPSETDDITVLATASFPMSCYELTGVSSDLSAGISIKLEIAQTALICPAVFQAISVPVELGRLEPGVHDIEVGANVELLCEGPICESEGIAISTMFAVVPSGDVDCDMGVGSIDAVLVLQYVARLIGALDCESAGDVNEDGAVVVTDAALILQHSAGLLEDLPV
jgi:hypothetical protein